MKMIHGFAAAFALAAGMRLLSGAAHSADTDARLADGTVEAGFSPDTGKEMYTTREDAPGIYTFQQAKTYCVGLTVDGEKDWRVPTNYELSVLFVYRAAIGGFDVTGSDSAGWYWSSTEDDVLASRQRFNDGSQGWNHKNVESSLRCVR